MKKIMIALAVVAMAMISQAAVVKWSTTAVQFNGTKLGGQSVSLYMVGINGADDVLIDTRSTLVNPAANKGKLTSGAGSAQSAYDASSIIAGGALLAGDGSDAGREYYMVITYNDGTKDYTYTSSAVASSGLSATAQGSVAFTFNDKISEVAGAKDAWVASVPEPTSGLLMLVGLAGLALRRRRA